MCDLSKPKVLQRKAAVGCNCINRFFWSVIRLIGTNAADFLLLYALVELLYSGYRYLTGGSPDLFSVFEHPGETIKFDPVRGYYLTRTPSRIARVNFGKIEYQGSYQCNAQGFADRDDFNTKRSSASQRRIAVFGDSFTAAIMEPLNSPDWPDRWKIYALSDITFRKARALRRLP
jgi:hypothetical protein